MISASKKICMFSFKNLKSKRIKILIIIFFILLFLYLLSSIFISHVNSASDTIENELIKTIDKELDSINTDDMDIIIDGVEGDLNNGDSFKDIVKNILSGEYYSNYDSLLSVIISLLFKQIINFIPYFLVIFGASIVSHLLLNFKGENFDSGISNIVTIVTLIIIITTCLTMFYRVFDITKSSISSMEKQTEIIFPILLTMLASIGSVVSLGIFKPIIAFLTTIINYIFSNIFFPLFIVTFVFIILNSLSNTIKLNKIIGFIFSLFKWGVGIIFTIFGAFLTIQGISAGKYDKISITTTKFAIKSYIPIIGGYISDGFDLIVLSSILIKNAVGVAGLFVLFITIISPVITLIVLKLLLQLVGSIIEIAGDDKISEFLSNCSKILIFPIVIILGIAFMYILSVGLLMCTANII